MFFCTAEVVNSWEMDGCRSQIVSSICDAVSLCVFPSIIPLSRMCVSECPSGFFRDDRRRCKKCSSLCDTCVGSRSDQCTSCRTGFHLNEGSNTCVANCADGFYLDHGTFYHKLKLFYNTLQQNSSVSGSALIIHCPQPVSQICTGKPIVTLLPFHEIFSLS